MITSEHYTPIRQYTRFYLRWRVRALAYLMLLDRSLPAVRRRAVSGRADDRRARPGRAIALTVGLRLLLAIPHFIVLFFVSCAWWVTTVIAWFAILITGRYPQGLYEFGAGALRWLIRVEAYVLLMIDDYPPFSFDLSLTTPRGRGLV